MFLNVRQRNTGHVLDISFEVVRRGQKIFRTGYKIRIIFGSDNKILLPSVIIIVIISNFIVMSGGDFDFGESGQVVERNNLLGNNFVVDLAERCERLLAGILRG